MGGHLLSIGAPRAGPARAARLYAKCLAELPDGSAHILTNRRLALAQLGCCLRVRPALDPNRNEGLSVSIRQPAEKLEDMVSEPRRGHAVVRGVMGLPSLVLLARGNGEPSRGPAVARCGGCFSRSC